jgi:hypothetical protein
MSLLRRITGKDRRAGPARPPEPAAEEGAERPSCPHTALVPRWDSIQDMGKEDKATSYFCQGCGRSFSPEEARPYLG